MIPSSAEPFRLLRGFLISFVTRLFIAAYFIDTGLLLVAAPWTAWWHRNFFADIFPWLAEFMTTRMCQVWVMATGAVTAVAGVIDVYGLVTGRHRADTGRRPLL